MVVKNVLKRGLPFIGAFVLGIFVASFFISISVPSFSVNKREGRRTSCWSEHRKAKKERMRERARQQELKNQSLEDLVPPPPPLSPVAPPAPSN